jgi:hypothetical protein
MMKITVEWFGDVLRVNFPDYQGKPTVYLTPWEAAFLIGELKDKIRKGPDDESHKP